jgi:hypothetical protein
MGRDTILYPLNIAPVDLRAPALRSVYAIFPYNRVKNFLAWLAFEPFDAGCPHAPCGSRRWRWSGRQHNWLIFRVHGVMVICLGEILHLPSTVASMIRRPSFSKIRRAIFVKLLVVFEPGLRCTARCSDGLSTHMMKKQCRSPGMHLLLPTCTSVMNNTIGRQGFS